MTPSEQIPAQVGPFRVIERLGAGGMGVVYRAVRVASNEVVALKTLRMPEELLLAGIRREIGALARIRHPGIVRIVAEGVQGGLPWYAMDLVHGVTLQRYGVDAVAPSAGEEERPNTGTAARPPRPAAEWWTESIAAMSDVAGTLGMAGRPLVHWPRKGGRPADGCSGRGGGSVSEVLRRILTVVRRLCCPLGFLHGEGIVHRDLKPDNVLVRAGGEPVIVDFGLADWFGAEVSREAIGGASGVVGTPAFMAPEQIVGEMVDARADLYALGCILYRLATGRSVFQVKDRGELLRAHRLTRPTPPSRVAALVPPELDELVLALLEKDPRDRPGHADDVAAVLVRLGADPEGASTVAVPAARPYLYRARCAGRAGELALLAERVGRMEGGRGGLALVGGDSGIGKTRLVSELALRAVAMNARVLLGDCPDARARPLEAFRKPLRAIADQCREWGRAETDRVLGVRGKVLALYVPELADLPGQERLRPAVELPAEEARLRLCNYVLETLAAASDDEPLLVILDDLQWADELSLAVLTLAARSGRFDGVPVLLVGTYRTEEASEALAMLVKGGKAASVRLGRLAAEAVAAMVADMLALRSAPAAFVEFLARSSEGNPFFVAEYLRLAVARQVLRRDEMGRWRVGDAAAEMEAGACAEPGETRLDATPYESLPLPASLRALVRAHLDALPATAREVLDAAAVAGREVDGEVLARVVGRPGLMQSDVVTQLLRRQLMIAAGSGRLSFAHDKIREVAYDDIDVAALPVRHRAVAAAVEQVLGTNDPAWFGALAQHWHRGGEEQKARDYYRRAAQMAAEQYAWKEADAAFDAYFGLGSDAPDRETTRMRIELAARSLSIRGRFDEAESVARQARVEAEALADAELVADTDEVLGSALRSRNRNREAGACYEKALAYYAAQGMRQRVADLVVLLGVIAWSECQLDRACTLWQQALSVYRDLDAQPQVATVLHNLAFALTDLHQFDVARNLFEEALAIPRTLGERHLEGTTLGGLGRLSLLQGDLVKARDYFAQALGINREVGELWAEAITTGCLAQIDMFRGAGAASKDLAQRAVLLNRQVGNRRDEATSLSVLAWGEAATGAMEAAFARFEDALTVHRDIGNPVGEALTLWQYAIWRRRIGDYGGASALLDQAEAAGARLERPLLLALVHCERGHHALAHGQPGDVLLEEARSTIQVPDVYLLQARDRLRRAIDHAARNLPLNHGECPLDDGSSGGRHSTNSG
ncbi:MAG: tetratricopeptide repeat protein [Candidatus Schekmanbacteria bacterium]|nr:tetratricopeptide repeat protein [Candidatus Schekmanbacteria bacterium]